MTHPLVGDRERWQKINSTNRYSVLCRMLPWFGPSRVRTMAMEQYGSLDTHQKAECQEPGCWKHPMNRRWWTCRIPMFTPYPVREVQNNLPTHRQYFVLRMSTPFPQLVSPSTSYWLLYRVDTPLDTPWIPCLDISCFNKTSDIIRFAPVQKDLA